ncbi:MAG: FG-GAP-like repeat-containing protein [Cyclobacteriaceae bacterium]
MESMQRILVCIMMLIPLVAQAQNPAIFSVDRTNAAVQDIITIHGRDFGSNLSATKVFFGAARGELKTFSNQIIEVKTPAGATFDRISVTNTSSGLTSSAPNQFFLNYQGEPGISAAEFSPQTDFSAQSGLYDLCLCDFNDDNKVDVATASNTSNLITVFQNTSIPGNIYLTGQDVIINARTLHVKCGDLNGDGRPEIVLSEGADGDQIFILKNNGTFSFSLQSITLTGIKVKRIAIADLDLDGKPEIVVTNTGGNILKVLPNQSTVSGISFGTPVNVTIPQASSTDALEISDLNGDGFPEIVTSQYQADSENKLFICINKGSFDFTDLKVIAINKAISNIRIGDLDGDAKPDIAIARLTGSDVSVYFNDGGSELNFRQPVFFITETLPVGIDFSDFDGDGKLDIAVGSIAKSVSVLNNTTITAGTGAFAPVVKLSTTYINRNLRNVDMDGDGKPDIVFTSVDDFSGVPVPASKISVLRNLSCMVPKLTPGGPLNICIGNPLELRATAGGGITYEWYQEGTPTPLKTGAEPFLSITNSGEYKVVALSGSGWCSRESNLVTVTMTTPTSSLTQTNSDARSNSPVCTDNTLNLAVNDVGASEYRWRGPNGFTQTANTPEVSRPNFTLQAAGLYIVEMMTGTCVAKTDSTLVEAVSIPDFDLSFSGGPGFCSGSTKSLSITPRLTSGFSYQWYENTRGLITEATFDNYSVNASGEYYAVITPDNPGCLPKETGKVVLTALTPPVANVHVPEFGCVADEISFSQQSTGDPNAEMIYYWTFGDGETSEEENPVNVYNQTNTFEVTLKVMYEGVQLCSDNASKVIDIFSPVVPVITATAMSMCEGESIGLSITGLFSSITWNYSSTAHEIVVDQPGEYSVATVDANGCPSSDEIIIEQKTIPVLTVSSDKEAIAAGQTVQLSGSGADEYSWSPGKTLNDSTISNPVASPQASTTYVLTGSLTDGCSATASIAIQVTGEVINVTIPILFSPNGDDVNEMLIIEGVENYPDCSLSVFDSRGGRVFESVGYKNNWDGTITGTPLPEGVYYYVFGCPNKKALTGTVTVIR